MLESYANVATASPERFVKQIVSHLGHRLTTELGEDGVGLVVREGGRCTLTPSDGVLLLRASADDEAAQAGIHDVIARHLERFGAREELRVIWHPGTPA